MAAKSAKSHKSDGTPKRRWTAAERAAGGRKAQRRNNKNTKAGKGSQGAPAKGDWASDEPKKSKKRTFDTSYGDGAGHSRPKTKRSQRDSAAKSRSRDWKPDRDRNPQQRDDRPKKSDWRPNRDRFDSDSRGRREYDSNSKSRRDDFGSGGGSRRDRYESADRRGGRKDRRDEYPKSGRRRFERDESRSYDRRGSDNPPARNRDAARFETRGKPNKSGRRDDQRGGHPRHRESGYARGSQHHRGERHRGHGQEQNSAPDSDQMSWQPVDLDSLEIVENSSSDFYRLGVHPQIVQVLAGRGIVEPFPIQRATINDALAGRDVLGRGRTGSGKTLAFGLPLLTRLAEGSSSGSPRAMILTPTRELALQIADDLSPLAAVAGLDLVLVAGGMSYGPQIRAFERGVDVVVATPGRLVDLLEQGVAVLDGMECVVLDEADHMSDLGFGPEVTRLLDAVPVGGQRLLFSATLDDAVDKIVKKYLNDPVTHEVDAATASVTTMTHQLLQTAPHDKVEVTAQIANREGKTVVFARTQRGAERVAEQLRQRGVLAGALHGGLTQGARARILAAFKAEQIPVLVATDVAARGIHVDDVTLVLQVDPPMNSKDYLHRAGRTARAGNHGVVATIVLPHQRKQMRRMTGQANVTAVTQTVSPGSPELREATGARPCSQTPIAEEEYRRIIAPRTGPGRRPRQRRDRRRR